MTFVNISVFFVKMYLRWGRPETAAGGEVGRGARGKGGSAGVVERGVSSMAEGGALVIIYYLEKYFVIKQY